jgi:glucose-6-phosphate 1-epimerase
VAFEAELRVRLEGDDCLEVALAVKVGQPARFTAALHSYLRVADVGRAVVRGLRGASYDSRAEGSEGGVQETDEVRVVGELDRVYLNVAGPLTLEDGPARLTLSQRGFTDVVLWNPGEAKAGQLSDLGPDEYRNMLCVEAASVGTAVALEPGESWLGVQRMHVVR